MWRVVNVEVVTELGQTEEKQIGMTNVRILKKGTDRSVH
jgi:hypothetical protein